MEWGRMEDRSVLQWDKDDCATMGIVKFDLLALGALNAMHLTVDLIEEVHGLGLDLATIPQEPIVYDLLTRADTVGIFQVESRAQMATLPKLKPRSFYDLAIEVALIRPWAHSGAVRSPLPPSAQRRGGDQLSASVCGADPEEDARRPGVSRAVDGTRQDLCRIHAGSV